MAQGGGCAAWTLGLTALPGQPRQEPEQGACALFIHRKAAMRSPWSLLFSRLNNANSLSLSAEESRCSPLTIFVALLWTRSNSSMSFLGWGPQSWTQYCRWGVRRAE